MAANKRPRMYATPEAKRGPCTMPRECRRALQTLAQACGFTRNAQPPVLRIGSELWG